MPLARAEPLTIILEPTTASTSPRSSGQTMSIVGASVLILHEKVTPLGWLGVALVAGELVLVLVVQNASSPAARPTARPIGRAAADVGPYFRPSAR